MNRIERGLWFAVAIVFGNLGGTMYQKYVVPKSTPVKYEQRGELRKVADAPPAEASEEQQLLLMLLMLLMQGVEIVIEPAPPAIEDGPREITPTAI